MGDHLVNYLSQRTTKKKAKGFKASSFLIYSISIYCISIHVFALRSRIWRLHKHMQLSNLWAERDTSAAWQRNVVERLPRSSSTPCGLKSAGLEFRGQHFQSKALVSNMLNKSRCLTLNVIHHGAYNETNSAYLFDKIGADTGQAIWFVKHTIYIHMSCIYIYIYKSYIISKIYLLGTWHLL